jgi:hypothetical protein
MQQGQSHTAVVVGVADSDYLELKGQSGYSVVELAQDVLTVAILDSGLDPQDIDCVGLTTYPRDSFKSRI